MQLHVAEAKGWAYVQDAPGKWGWVAQEPGATLLLKVGDWGWAVQVPFPRLLMAQNL